MMLKHELFHFFASLVIGIVSAYMFGEPLLVFISFIFGFLIDADHLFDYLFWFKNKFKISDFFNTAIYVRGNNKVFVLLHGWEYIFLIFLIGNIFNELIGIRGVTLTAVFSYLVHLVWDQICVLPKPLGYFVLYRIINNFKLEAFNNK